MTTKRNRLSLGSDENDLKLTVVLVAKLFNYMKKKKTFELYTLFLLVNKPRYVSSTNKLCAAVSPSSDLLFNFTLMFSIAVLV